MKPNIGKAERVFRVILGLAIVGVALYYQNWWGLVGLEVTLTGILGWSPVYKLFSISASGPKVAHV